MCIQFQNAIFEDLGNKIVYKNFRIEMGGSFSFKYSKIPEGKFQGLYHNRLYEIGKTYDAEELLSKDEKFIQQKYYKPGFHGFYDIESCDKFDGMIIIKCKLFGVYVSGNTRGNLGINKTFVGKRLKLMKIMEKKDENRNN